MKPLNLTRAKKGPTREGGLLEEQEATRPHPCKKAQRSEGEGRPGEQEATRPAPCKKAERNGGEGRQKEQQENRLRRGPAKR